MRLCGHPPLQTGNEKQFRQMISSNGSASCKYLSKSELLVIEISPPLPISPTLYS